MGEALSIPLTKEARTCDVKIYGRGECIYQSVQNNSIKIRVSLSGSLPMGF